MNSSQTGTITYLVVLVTVVVEHLADEGAPHQLGVSMFDLTEKSGRFSHIHCLLECYQNRYQSLYSINCLLECNENQSLTHRN